MTDRSRVHLVESGALRYLLSLPESSKPPIGAWPVLCFLHGYDEGAPTEIRRGMTRHGPLRPESSPRATGEFIVVAPQLPRSGDLWHHYADAVLGIVRQVQALYGGDPQRTYLTGFSFGGNGVFDLALRQSDFWAALWPVDPTRVPASDPARPVWLSFGEIARRGKPRFVERLGLEPADEQATGDRLYLDREEDHVASAASAYADDRVYTWLLSRSRAPDQDLAE